MEQEIEMDNKQNIGIVTFHGADNYGSVLQSYALRNAVKNITGYQAEIINYITAEQNQLYAPFFKANTIKNVLKNIYILFFLFQKRLHRKHAFVEFRNKYLETAEKDHFSDMNSCSAEKYDSIICGSDQIWNISIKDFHVNYMLSFAKGVRKISYAASMGGLELQLEEDAKDRVKRLLKDFQAISVREHVAQRMLADCAEQDIYIHIDPVFLLDAKVWKQLASPRRIQEEYLFFYSVDYNEDSVEIAKWYAKKHNLPLYIMYTSWNSYFICRDGIRWAGYYGVEDFLSLTAYAKFVLSGSFHGAAFSILFNKPFLRIQKRIQGAFVVDDRIQTLFEKLGVKDREINISNYRNYDDQAAVMDYNVINRQIEAERKSSYDYFRKYL